MPDIHSTPKILACALVFWLSSACDFFAQSGNMPAPDSDPSQILTVEGAPEDAYPPPSAPVGLQVLLLKEGVYLNWTPPPEPSVVRYNVYRSTVPGGPYTLVNAVPIEGPYFLDSPGRSLLPPRNGELYFYVVTAVDALGQVSEYSDEIPVQAQGLAFEGPRPEDAEKKEGEKEETVEVPDEKEERVLTLPERGFSIGLPAESQIQVQGYKKIETRFTRQKFFRQEIGGIPAVVNTNDVNQELVVNLDGKIGKNVDVHVDFSDVNRSGGVDDSKQEISVVYRGEEDSAIQEVAFGDILLSIPNTEFAGFNKQLFGLQGKAKFGDLRLTTLFAQTKGITETKTFRGNTVQQDRTILDTEYVRNKFFLITKESKPATVNGQVVNQALPQAASEQIWVDDGIATNNTGGANFKGSFELFLPGTDYTIDYSTGVITFIRGIGTNHRIAVAFTQRDGTRVGFGPDGQIDVTNGLSVPSDGVIANSAHLLKDNVNPAQVSPLALLNYYELGGDPILPPEQDPDFLFEIIDQGTNQVVQTGQSDTSRWRFEVDLNFNRLIVTDTTDPVFPERPFKKSATGTGTNEVYSQTTTPTSNFRVRLRYKTRVDFFRLDRFNIIRGSESVFVDGRRLRRDQDYFMDYISGFLDFPDPTLIRPDSEIVVTYEFSPFGAAAQSNIFGARAEYDLAPNLFLGSTFLFNGSQRPLDIPAPGSTPNSLSLLDADARWDLDRKRLKGLTSFLPGLSNWTPPVDLKLSAEIASSRFQPNTFSMEEEDGVAMIDSMEGVEDVTAASINETRWVVSSAPSAVGFLGGFSYVASSGTANNRLRFRNGGDKYGRNKTNGGHVFQQTGRPEDKVDVLQFPYSGLTEGRWAGVRQVLSSTGLDVSTTKFFQAWVHNDGQDKWIVFDFGVLSEDANGDSTLQEEGDPANPSSQDIGVPVFYRDDPNTATTGPGDENLTQEGRGNGVFDTEDINSNGQLDTSNAYFQYGVRANWTGWRLVKIPVDFQEPTGFKTTTDGLSYFFNKAGAPSAQNIRAVRFWMTGSDANPKSGVVLLESLELVRNRWELTVEPSAVQNRGVSVNTNKFDVSSISEDQDPRYDPTLRFIRVQEGQAESSLLSTEKALKITYDLSDADWEPPGDLSGKPVYFATRRFPQSLDLADFEELRLDLQVKTVQTGDVLFVRLENDTLNYYEYHVELKEIPLNLWQPVALRIDGSDGKRTKIGRPFLNRVTQISIGVFSPNPPTGVLRELWVNNLRAASSTARKGIARRVNASLVVGDQWATISTRYRDVDAGFSQIDQTATRFQRNQQRGLDFASSSMKVFGQPVVVQSSLTEEERLTPDELKDHPFYADRDDFRRRLWTGSLTYSRDLPLGLGRLTNVRFSGSNSREERVFLDDFLTQPGVQGNQQKQRSDWSIATTYDAPAKILDVSIGTNQIQQSFVRSRDIQNFEFETIPDFDRKTRQQTYGWTNTTQLFKNFTFSPGYSWSITEALGNTNFPGQAGRVEEFTVLEKRVQPKIGVVFRGIPGLTPSIDYAGSNQFNGNLPTGDQLQINNVLNYSLSVTPGNWLSAARKINLTFDGGRTETSTALIRNLPQKRPLTFEEKWSLDAPLGLAFTGTDGTTHRMNGGFRLFQIWDFRPTASWTEQFQTLSEGAPPARQLSRTLGFITVFNKKLLRLPYARFSFNALEFQVNRTDNARYDTSRPARLESDVTTLTYTVSFPYDINEKGQGNLRFQKTDGERIERGVETLEDGVMVSAEYIQRFLQNKVLRIPFTKWKLRFEQALELRLILSFQETEKQSDFVFNREDSTRYRGDLQLNYNAWKNIRLGLNFARENFLNHLDPQKSFNLWQGGLSLEARF